MTFKVTAVFSINTIPRPKVGLPSLDIHQFSSVNERLILSKRHLKRSICVEFQKKSLEPFFINRTTFEA